MTDFLAWACAPHSMKTTRGWLLATAATTAPNIVRWSAAGTAWLWLALADSMPAWQSAAIVAALVLPVAFLAVFGLRESYGTDLDFQEE